MSELIRMPQLAAGGEDATIVAWLVQAGDAIAVGRPLAEIETEKAVVEYEAQHEGVFAGALVEAGSPIPVGTGIAVIAAEGESTADALAEHAPVGADGSDGSDRPDGSGRPDADSAPEADAPAPERPADAPAPERAATPAGAATDAAASAAAASAAGARIFSSPLARKLAKEAGVDVAELTGTGPNGRIVRRDIERHLAEGPASASVPAAPAAGHALTESAPSESAPADPAPTGQAAAGPAATGPAAVSGAPAPGTDRPHEDIPHTGMRRAIARRLTESKSSVPHFYLKADLRVGALLDLRARLNEVSPVKISVNDLVVKAAAAAFVEVPEANSIWTDTAVRRFEAVDIAVAVSVPNGLVTPVVRDVQRKSLSALSAEIRELAGRGREGRLKQHELEGGSFSVSNLGMYGTEEFSAILNPPQSGILAVGAAADRPVVGEGGALEVAKVMTVTLSADHRVLDGALAAQWLAAFVRRIEEPMSLLV